MKAIDFRFRPHTKDIMEGIANSKIFRPGMEAAGVDMDEFAASYEPIEEIVTSMKENGMLRGVIVCRDTETTMGYKSNNEEMTPFIQQYPDLFIGFAGIDPLKGMVAVRALEHLVKDDGFQGAAIEPFYCGLRPDDALNYPIYAKCCELGVPIVITTGMSPGTPRTYIQNTHPMYIDKVANDFPELKIVVSHGCYPFVADIIGVASRNANVYFEISDAVGLALSHLYYEAANDGDIADKLLFASAHPFTNFEDAVKMYESFPIHADILEKVMWKNAATVLGLSL